MKRLILLLLTFGISIQLLPMGGPNTPFPRISLWKAVSKKNFAGAEWMLDNASELEIEINAVNNEGQTFLAIAAQNGDARIIKLLLKAGANPNQPTADGSTPLHIATRWANFNIVKMLIDHGADVNTRNKLGITPLHAAVMRGDIKIAELLLNHGANINAQDSYRRRTPLHWVIRMTEGSTKKIARQIPVEQSVQLIKLLLARGANPALLDLKGKTALQWAIAFKIEPLIIILSEAMGVETKKIKAQKKSKKPASPDPIILKEKENNVPKTAQKKTTQPAKEAEKAKKEKEQKSLSSNIDFACAIS